MSNPTNKETSRWDPVKDLMQGKAPVTLGNMLSYQARKSPRRILFSQSYFKFAAKMIGKGKSVLDVGCSEGLGTWLLAHECGKAHGIDIDEDAVKTAQANWTAPNISFEYGDFLEQKPQQYDAAISLDVIEHIRPDNASAFIKRIADNLTQAGTAIIGTPNINSDQYASPITREGHINLYSGERLEAELKEHFKHVFVFAANDEIIHTGYFPMAHALIALACGTR